MIRVRRDLNDVIGKTMSFKRACEFKYKDSAKVMFAGAAKDSYINAYKSGASAGPELNIKSYYGNCRYNFDHFGELVNDYMNKHCFDKHRADMKNALACDDKLFD